MSSGAAYFFRLSCASLAFVILAVSCASPPRTGTTGSICVVGDSKSCPSGRVCAKTDANGNTACLDILPEPEITFLFPFDKKTEVICTQSHENSQGTHGFGNMLFAIDLTTPFHKPPSTVRASAEGKAFVFSACKSPSGRPEKTQTDSCGLGFGNHVRILHKAGYVSLYVHLEKVFIRTGDLVKAGQPIGIEGWTGSAAHRHLHWDVNKLRGSAAEQWESTLQNPGWGGVSVPFNFKVSVDGKEKVLNSKDISCSWDDMTQRPWRGTK